MENKKGIVVASNTIPGKKVEAGFRTTMQILINTDHAPNFIMRCFTMEPGGGIPNHTNTVEHEQYVLSGCAKIGIGEEEYDVKEGDAVFIPAGIPHWYKTKGDEAFKVLCLIPNETDRIELIDQ